MARRPIELAVAVAIVGALVAAAHWPVLDAQALSLDDRGIVANNPLVEHPGVSSAARIFREVLAPSTITGYYMPLSMLSLMLDDAMGGRPDNLRAFHRTSLALHVLNSILVLLLMYALFGATIPAALAALIFGLHPLTVEPTAWVAERKTLLSTFFALGCMLSYAIHCRRRERAWLAVSAALYALALLAKPTVVMVPFLLLLLDAWPLRRLNRGAVAEKWPFFALLACSVVITVISHERTAGIMPSDILRWPLRAAYVLSFYLAKMVWPVNLSSVYELPAPFALTNVAVLLGVATVCGLTAFVIVLRRRTPAPLVGWIFFVLAVAPTLGLVNYSWVVASDKYVYFPAVGVLMVTSSGLVAAVRALAGRRRLASVLGLIVLAIFGLEARGTRATAASWKDSITLYRHMAAVAPHNATIQTGLGSLLLDGTAREEGMEHLRRAVALDTTLAVARFNLGTALGAEGRLDEAIRQLQAAERLKPGDIGTLGNLGTTLALAGRLDEAADSFNRVLRIDPRSVTALDQLGSVLMLQGRTKEAVEHFRKAHALDQRNPEIDLRLAGALQKLGGHDAEEATSLRAAMQSRPGWAEPVEALSRLLATSRDASLRDPQEAVRLAERAVELTGGKDASALEALREARAAAKQ